MNRVALAVAVAIAAIGIGPCSASANPTVPAAVRLTTTAGADFSAQPSIAYNKDLDVYLAVYQVVTGGVSAVQAQVYSSAFAAVGGAKVLANNASQPAVAYNSVSREFVVAFVTAGATEWEISAIRLRGDGAFTATGVLVSDQPTASGLLDLSPRVAVNTTTGGVFFVWQSDDADGKQDIKGRLFDSTLLAPVIAQTTYYDAVTPITTGTPGVAFNPISGEFLIVLTDTSATRNVIGQRVGGATGTEAGTNDFLITSRDPADRAFVACNTTTGDYLVTFPGYVSGTELEVYGRVVSSTGVVQGAADLRISQAGPDTDVNYTATVMGASFNSVDGDYVVLWQGDHTIESCVDDEFEVFGQQLSAAGAEIGTDFRISHQGTDAALTSPVNAATMLFDSDHNRFVALWEGETDKDLYATGFSTGTPIVCGNGSKSGSEGCDDNNTNSGDGCSSVCNVEPGWNCSGASCVCVSNCVTTCSPGTTALVGSVNQLPSSSTAGGDVLLAVKRTVVSPFALQQLTVRAAIAQSSARLALYSDVAGEPGALLAQTGAVPLLAGENRLDVTSAINLAAGTYWVAIVVQDIGLSTDASIAAAGSGTVAFRSKALAFGAALPASFTTPTSFTAADLDLNLRGCACLSPNAGLPGPGCAPYVCGNGLLEGSEICDDGNTTGTDGCSADCTTVATGYLCSTPGSLCTCAPGFVGPPCIAESVNMQIGTPSSTSAAPGSAKTITVVVKNNGNSTKSATAKVTFPSYTTLVPTNGNGWTCVGTVGVGWVCARNFNAVASGGTSTSTLSATVDSGATVSSITLTIGIDAVNNDLTTADDSTTLISAIDQTVDLATSISCPASVTPGNVASCTVTASNTAAGNAVAPTLSMTVPVGATFNAGASSGGITCTPNNNAGATCTRTLGTLGLSASQNSTYVFSVVSPADIDVESLSLSASVTSSNTDSNGANNTGLGSVSVVAAPVLTITTTPSKTTVQPGDVFTASFSVANTGNQNAKAAVLSATVDNAVTPSGAGWTCVAGATTWTCTRTASATIVVGTPFTASLTLTVADPVGADVTSVAIASSVTHARAGTEAGTDTDLVSVTVDASANVSITSMTADGASVLAGGTRKFTIEATNTGKKGAKNVLFEVQRPAYATYTASGSTVSWSCNATQCSFTNTPELPGKDGKKTVVIAFVYDAHFPADVVSSTVQASVTAPGAGDVPKTNGAQTSVTVTAAPHLVVDATAAGNATPGSPYAVTITAKNTGTQDAKAVVVDVTLPDTTGAATSDPAWSCSPQGGNVTKCSRLISLLDLNPVISVVRPVPIDPFTAGKLGLSVTVTAADDASQGTDLIGAVEKTKTVVFPVNAKPSFTLTSTDDGNTASPGSHIVYALGYAVGGTQHAQGVTLTETVPTGTTYSTAGSTPGWSCANGAVAGSTCAFTLGALNVGTQGTVTFAVDLSASIAAGAMTNSSVIADNGQNAAHAVQSTSATATVSVLRCERSYLFTGGNGPFVLESLFSRVVQGADAVVKTGGASNIPAGRQIGRVQVDVPVPSVAVGGPNPQLEVTYRLEGNPNPLFDVFAICIGNPTCDGQTLGNAFQTGTNTAGPGFQTARVSLRSFAGTTAHATLLFDTITSAGTGVPGLTITAVRVVSDADNDGFSDGSFAECDTCWDEDGDGYVHSLSPTLATCPNPTKPDCNDQLSTSRPDGAELCGVVGDEDCDGLADGLDTADCGFEDCANGTDDNGDGKIDCADPVCAGRIECGTCSAGFSLDTGLGGFVASDNDPDGDAGTQVFGLLTVGADKGVRTAPSGTLASVNTTGKTRVRATLTRTVTVPAGTPDPALFVRYSLAGEVAAGKDVFGVCFNTPAAQCGAATPAGAAPFKTDVETALRVEKIALPVTSGDVSVTLFYDTVDDQNNANTGVFIDSVVVGSDADKDGSYESDPPECDHCVDADLDGFGSQSVAPEYVLGCASALRDCNDLDNKTKPTGVENCALAGDNDCNGKADAEEPSCSVCGDGSISAGEVCDDSNNSSGDGCSSACALEAGAFVVTELHVPTSGGPQWVEIKNVTTSSLNVVTVGLLLERQTGTQLAVAACTVRPGKSATVAPGAYFVFGLVPPGASLAGLDADVSCPAAGFQLASDGDILRVKAGSLLIDTVDYRGFACEVGGLTGALGRSLELSGAATAAANDSAGAWCLTGPGAGVAGVTQVGSPGSAGTCAEIACDGNDDDCDGATDESLPDTDSDGVCNELDCDPTAPTCKTDCVTDVDSDLVADCRDGCIDKDGDGFGVSGGLPVATCALVGGQAKLDCNDSLSFVSPVGSEVGADACTNGEDDDCDGTPDCAESACAALAVCAGETCATATALTCGGTVTVEPATNELPCAPGDDAVVAFTAARTEVVTIGLSNLGQRQFQLVALSGICTNGACASPINTVTVGCATPATVSLSVVAGQKYSIVADAVGPCPGTGAGSAAISLKCGEVCTPGVDADADGLAGCADGDCVLAPACLLTDFDGDGVSNTVEATCSTDPRSSASVPSADDVSNTDADALLNCVDTDDDADGTVDTIELAQCTLNGTAKNDNRIFPGATINCDLAGIDANCNSKFDTTETGCGATESQCADGADNDGDSLIDCADSNCVSSPLCGSQDFDGDGVINRVELLCNTNAISPLQKPTVVDATDTDLDGVPNCADIDDDGDGFDDVTEAICGSNGLVSASRPADADSDGQCDAADPDDDNDGFSDAQEVTCGTSPTSAASTPADAVNDLDHDGRCNVLDADADGDGWTNGVEVACDANPLSAADSPSVGHDVDGDGKCDALDGDDDNDQWTDAQEVLCGTSPVDAASVPVDTDGDGYCDALDTDSDSDGWPDALEIQCGTSRTDSADNPAANGTDDDTDGLCDAVDDDDDGDGWSDTAEAACGSAPHNLTSKPVDTDTDGACDTIDDDDDADGWTDATELLCGTNPLAGVSKPVDTDGDGLCDAVDPGADPDADGWSSFDEGQCGTDATLASSKPVDTDLDGLCDVIDLDDDGDGWLDQEEAACGTDAALIGSIPTDTDGDGACDPVDTDDDGDGSPDLDEDLCGSTRLDKTAFPLEIDVTDTDDDGVANCVDLDDDGDGVEDTAEVLIGSSPLVVDTDGDGLEDGVENANADGVVDATETSPIVKDTDKDGLDDDVETSACYHAGPCVPTSAVKADTDGDGLDDGVEDVDGNGAVDDGETDPLVVDSDGDTSSDGVEVGCHTDPLDKTDQPKDADANGICDRAEADSDGDGVPDGVEAVCGTAADNAADAPALNELVDTDLDGKIDCADLDDDNDGAPDLAELQCGTKPLDPSAAEVPSAADLLDTDGDGALDCADTDDDNDGLADVEEEALCEDASQACAGSPGDAAGGASMCSDPHDKDTDDDGIPDGKEAVVFGTSPVRADTDCDGVLDGTELGVTKPTTDTDPAVFVPDADPTTATDPKLADTDSDGVGDGEEDKNHNGMRDDGESNPQQSKDGLLDTDGDGLPDRVELEAGTDPADPDTDGDGLDDKLELSVTKTDPLVKDTDAGGVPDGIEVQQGTDPNDKTDDYANSVASGDNVFGCATSSRAANTGYAAALALVAMMFLALRRSRRPGR